MVEHAVTTAEMGCSNMPVILAPQVLEVETKGSDGQHPLKSHMEATDLKRTWEAVAGREHD